LGVAMLGHGSQRRGLPSLGDGRSHTSVRGRPTPGRWLKAKLSAASPLSPRHRELLRRRRRTPASR
jgi:hypothetical protein